jgi:hypothetical protein
LIVLFTFHLINIIAFQIKESMKLYVCKDHFCFNHLVQAQTPEISEVPAGHVNTQALSVRFGEAGGQLL